MAKAQGHRPGGGIASNKNVAPGYRHGQPKKRTIPAGVAQLGQRQGNHFTRGGPSGYGGVPVFGGQGYPSELGNKRAVETPCGVGGGRTIYKTGTQGMTGTPDRGQPPSVGEIFPGFKK
jgi:hypothetical protein